MVRFPRRQRRSTTYIRKYTPHAIIGAWGLLACMEIGVLAHVIGQIPGHVHAFLLSFLPTATVTAVVLRQRTPVRAAFLDGMLWEREHPADVDLPAAVGDEPAPANVVTLPRNSGRHRPSPAPRPRRRGD